MYLIGKESNVEKDGLIILTLVSIKDNGHLIKNGFYFYFIHAMVINGQKYLKTCQDVQIIISKIIGIQL
jgi:hypothetical protein